MREHEIYLPCLTNALCEGSECKLYGQQEFTLIIKN